MLSLKKIFNIALYLSILSFVIYLYRFNYLQFADIKLNYFYFILSVLLLWMGFYVSTVSWKKALLAQKISITQSQAIYSHGISVFAKYIPGKIWVILGRASLISEKGFSMTATSSISLKEQLAYLQIGMIFGLLVIPFIPINKTLVIVVVLTAVGLGLFIFVPTIHEILNGLLTKFLKKHITIPFVSFNEALTFISYILIYWTLWSIAFFLLCKSILPEISPWVAFAFPISISFGLLAIFVPGGIGIRESIIVLFLTSFGIALEQSILISVIQRLWFVSGEVFIFTLALINRRKWRFQ